MDSPEKQRKRKKLADRFDNDWEFDFKNVQIKRKHKSFVEKLKGIFKSKKHSVFAMYWWLKYQYMKDDTAKKFYFPLKHDNIPVKGLPFKYEMKGKWTIPSADLKYLYGGPLISQELELLVPPEDTWKKVIRISKNLAKVLTPIFGFIFFLFRYKEEIREIFNWIKNSL
ncbi:hypothetical protein ACEZ3G_01005 [Maribacter algicola]|uniref:Uncharacterized protein n=1 Tax=Meishania litoralis TaxID=3434685 RepID=A0ACC7LEQ4_9FLAO